MFGKTNKYFDGTSKAAVHCITSMQIGKTININDISVTGCDGFATNTCIKGGII